MKFIKIYFLSVILFLLLFTGTDSLLAGKKPLVELKKLPADISKELNIYIGKYNKSKEPSDDFASYDPRINQIPKDGYYFSGKYLIPLSKSGSNFAFTIFLLWDKEIKECFTTDGFSLISLEQIKDYPLLNARYAAGCCDKRYIASGVISLKSDIPKNLFILPEFAQNTKERHDGLEVYSNLYFKLISDIEIELNNEKSDYLFKIRYWAKINPTAHTEISGFKMYKPIKKPDRPPDLFFDMIYNIETNNIVFSDGNELKNNFLKKNGFPGESLSPVMLIQLFTNWIDKDMN